MKLAAELDGATVPIEIAKLDDGRYKVTLRGRTFEVEARAVGMESSPGGPAVYSLLMDAASFEVRVAEDAGEGGNVSTVSLYDDEYKVAVSDPRRAGHARRAGRTGGAQRLQAPMHGKVVRVLVERGERVARGQGLCVMEAMKMENELKAACDGTVVELPAKPGTSVTKGTLLAIVEPEPLAR